MKLLVKNGIASFMDNIVIPNTKGAVQANIIADKDTKFVLIDGGSKKEVDVAGIEAACVKVMKEKNGGKLPPNFKNYVIRSNKERNSQETGERWEGYEDDNGIHFCASCNVSGPKGSYPNYVDQQGNPFAKDTKQKGKPVDVDGVSALFYSGARVTTSLNISAYDVKDKETGVRSKGVTCYLNGIKFVKDGTPLGGVQSAVEDDLLEDTTEEESTALEEAGI